MQAIRQLGAGVIIAIISVILVLGGIVLSLAENLPSAATPTKIPPTLPLSFPTPTATQTPVLQTATETISASPSPSPSPSPTATQALAVPTVCTPPPGWVHVFAAPGDTLYALAQRYRISPETLSAANCLTSFDLSAPYALYVPPIPTVTIIPCGPLVGWVKTHIVQPGDNLYRIALSYGITYPQLQRANCMGNSTTIYTGQRLWVPNVPTRTPVPGVTIIPEFPTETSTATATPTATDTSIPTSTATATQPPTATATQTSVPTATWTSIPTETNTPPSPAPSQ
jgi:LysM repeat protein